MMLAKATMEIDPNVQLNIVIAILIDVSPHVPRHMVLSESCNSIVNSIVPEQVQNKSCHTVVPVEATSKLFVQENERATDPNISEDWTDTIKIASEYTGYPFKNVNVLEQFKGLSDGRQDNSIQPSMQSGHPRQESDQFMLYHTAPVRKRKRLKRGKW